MLGIGNILCIQVLYCFLCRTCTTECSVYNDIILCLKIFAIVYLYLSKLLINYNYVFNLNTQFHNKFI